MSGVRINTPEELKQYLMEGVPHEPSDTMLRILFGIIEEGADPYHVKASYDAGFCIGKGAESSG